MRSVYKHDNELMFYIKYINEGEEGKIKSKVQVYDAQNSIVFEKENVELYNGLSYNIIKDIATGKVFECEYNNGKLTIQEQK